MTTLALTAANASGISVALFVDNAVGIFATNVAAFALDYKLLYPALFSKRPAEGPKLDDLQLSQATEGTPAIRGFGECVRTGGWLMWQTKLRQVRDSDNGGKGGSGGEFLVFKYYKHLAVEISRVKRGRPISDILKILADGKIFYSNESDINFSSDDISAFAFYEPLPGGTGNNTRNTLELRSNHASGGPDLSKLQSGKNLTIGGFVTLAGNHPLTGFARVAGTQDTANGAAKTAGSKKMTVEVNKVGNIHLGDTFTVVGFAGGPYTVTKGPVAYNGIISPPTYDPENIEFTPGLAGTITGTPAITLTKNAAVNNGTYYCISSQLDEVNNESVAIIRSRTLQTYPFAGCDAADTVTIFQEKPNFSISQASDVRFYYGDQDQQADPLIAEFEEDEIGAGNTPTWFYRSYFVVEDFEVTDFGNRIPNWEIIWKPDSDITLRNGLTQICLDAGIVESNLDVSLIPADRILRGFAYRGPTPLKTILQSFTLVHNILHQRVGSVLKLFPREFARRHTVPITDFGAHESDEHDVPYPFEVVESGNLTAVQEVVVKYIDPDKDYQTKSVRSRLTDAISDEVSEINTQMVLTADEAQRLSDKLLAQNNLGRNGVKWRLMPSWYHIVRENDVLVTSAYNKSYELLVTSVEQGHNYILSGEAIEEDLEILNQTATAEGTLGLTVALGGGREPRSTRSSPAIIWQAMNLPPLTDQQLRTPGWFMAACVRGKDSLWSGCQLFESEDQDFGYQPRNRIVDEAVMGNVKILPLFGGNRYVLDNDSVVEVELLKDWTLESVTEQAMLNGRNRFLFGEEIIGVQNWELISENTSTGIRRYRGTTLLRGLLNTFAIAHVENERFVWLDGPGITFIPISTSRISQPIYVKLVSYGGAVEEAVGELFTPDGCNIKPFRVVGIVGTRDGSNNLTITWSRQSRRHIQAIDQNAPLDEEVEQYYVRPLLTADAVESLRQFIVSTPTCTYSAAEQTADGLTPGDPVIVEIVPVSSTLYEGQPTIETV